MVGCGAAPAPVAKAASPPTATSPVATATPRRNRDMPPASRALTCLPHSLVVSLTCAFAEAVDPGYWPGNFGASVVKGKGRYNRFAQFQLLHYEVAIPPQERGSHAIITRLCGAGEPRSAGAAGPSSRAAKAQVAAP